MDDSNSDITVDHPMFLLGAGASKEAGLPTSIELTEEIGRTLKDRDNELSEVYDFIVERIMQSHPVPDVEHVYSIISLVREAVENDISLFVNEWHPKIVAWSKPTHGTLKNTSLLDKLGERILEAVYEKLWLNPEDPRDRDRVAHVLPLMEWARTTGFPLSFATLNFDNVLELAADSTCLSFRNTIFSLYGENNFLAPEQSVVAPPTLPEILHVHGFVECSMGCCDVSDGKPSGGGWPELDHCTPSDPDALFNPAIAFGHDKISSLIPVSDLISVFRRRLAQHNTLYVIGYSFRDPHITQCLFEWLNVDHTDRRLHAVGPDIRSEVRRGFGPWSNISRLVRTHPITAGEFFRNIADFHP